MTLSVRTASRIAVLASALAYTAASFGLVTSTAPLSAQGAPYYTAQLAQPADDTRAIAGGLVWACEGSTCVANKGTSRPARVCRGLAREVGEITEFRAKGEALEAEDLAKCNGK